MRLQHSGFPMQEVDYCLKAADFQINHINHLVIGCYPNAKFKDKMSFLLKKKSKHSCQQLPILMEQEGYKHLIRLHLHGFIT